MTPVAWILVAFVTAIVVMVVAGSTTGARPGVRLFFADLRAGRRNASDAGGIGPLAAARRDLHDVAEPDDDGGVADLFRLGQPTESAYVDPTELTAPLARATRRTVRMVARLVRA